MIEEINKEAFELIELVTSKPKHKTKPRENQQGSMKERGFHDLSEKLVDGGIVRTTDHSDNTVAIFSMSKNGIFGFDEDSYPRYKSLVEKISSLEEFKDKVAASFIESKAFNWVLDIYLHQKAGISLVDHLRTEVENNISSFEFYFPVLNLEIGEPFKIGNVEFTFFTKEYLDNLHRTIQEGSNPMGEKSFDEIFRKDYQGQVLAKITVRAEREKAEKVAKYEAEKAVDVLKIYGLTPPIPEKRTMFDLNFRLNYQVKSNFLSQNIDAESGLSLNLKFNNPPFHFNKQHLTHANQNGLKSFSSFLVLKSEHELYALIIQAIHLLGKSLSNWDLHLRSVNLITILESLLLKDDETNDMERRAKARLSKLISDDFKEKEKIKEIFGKIYQIRHKMIHKAKRIPINAAELSQVQIILINLLLRLIDLNTNKGFTEKNALIEKVNQIKS